jgi:hypothetical protein
MKDRGKNIEGMMICKQTAYRFKEFQTVLVSSSNSNSPPNHNVCLGNYIAFTNLVYNNTTSKKTQQLPETKILLSVPS